MATPSEKLAASLSLLEELHKGGRRVFRSRELTRVHRERLVRNGFVREVMKGWLISSSPDVAAGDIHPYADGNGRMARFVMNALLASGGYPWTVIRVDDRDACLASLERASIDQDMEPFARFLAKRVELAPERANANSRLA